MVEAELTQALKDILGVDNALRSQAEAKLNSAKESNPNGLLANYLQIILAPGSEEIAGVKNLACILRKKHFVDSYKEMAEGQSEPPANLMTLDQLRDVRNQLS